MLLACFDPWSLTAQSAERTRTNPLRVPSPFLSTLLYISPGTIPRLTRDVFGIDNGVGKRQMQLRQFKPPSESVMANVCLGVAVASVNTLIGIGVVVLLIL